jgi:hypothetical protein
MATLKERYKNLKTLVVERKEPFTRLMHHLETETAWLTAPASTRFHLCREEGLLEHSVNVAETMLKLKDTLAPDITDESCVIVALLHDLGKAGTPGQPQYLEGGKYPYSYNRDLVYLSVPVRSLYLALPWITLSEEEAQAIIYHDGQYVDDNASVAHREEPLTLLLQYADTWSGFVLENPQKKRKLHAQQFAALCR